MDNRDKFIEAGFNLYESSDTENKLLAFLKEHYPGVIKDNEIDLSELKAVAGLPVADKVMGYGLNFVGLNNTADKRNLQRDYYDHIIRNYQSYLNIKNYIINNPKNQGNDRFNN